MTATAEQGARPTEESPVERGAGSGRHRSSRRGAMIIVFVMFGWLGVVVAAGAVVSKNDPNIEVPLPVNAGVVVTPADGWYSAEDSWDVGETGLALQSSGVYVAFWAEEYGGTTAELLAEVREDIERQSDQFIAQPEGPVRVAGDLSGLGLEFTASSDFGRTEGLLVVVAHNGLSVVMLAEASYQGLLGWAQGDIDWMLTNLDIPR